MKNVYTVNLNKFPEQRAVFNLPLNGKSVPMAIRLSYNARGDLWHMDIENERTGEVILANVPLLCGADNTYNLLKQFEYLGIGSAYIKKVVENTDTDSPDYNTFLSQFVLMWGD